MKKKYKVTWRHPESTDIEEYIEAENEDELEKGLGFIQAVEAYAGSASDVDWIEVEEVYICEMCQRAYEPEEEELAEGSVRKLKTFKGYTVDLRLLQFRRLIPHAEEPSMEFIDFASAKGQELLTQMHEEVTRKTNKHWYPYKKLGAYFKLIDGVLYQCPMNANGTRDDNSCVVDEWYDLGEYDTTTEEQMIQDLEGKE